MYSTARGACANSRSPFQRAGAKLANAMGWPDGAVLARGHSANTGLGSPVTQRGRGIWLGIPAFGNRMAKEVSPQRPSVAGGLISQANRPLARHSWWACGGDPKGPSQSSGRGGYGKSPRNRDPLQETKPK